MSAIPLYGMSLLSVPVALLWPIWATLTAYVLSKENFKKNCLRLIPFFVLMFTFGFLNYQYYFTSETYKEIYLQKSASIEYSFLPYHIGHHLKQILYPFSLRFHYRLDSSSLWFFGIFIIASLWLFIRQRKDRFVWIWSFYSLIGMGLFLRTPEIYFDTYVILPAIGFFIIATRILNPAVSKFFPIIALPVLIVSTLLSNPLWTSLRSFDANNFYYNQDCTTARQLAETVLSGKQKLSNELYDFIQQNKCLESREGDSPVITRAIRNLESRLLLIEDDIDLEYRKKRLLEISRENYYPKIIYALLMSRLEDDAEVEVTMLSLNEVFKSIQTPLDYDPIVTDELRNYCQQKDLPECKRFAARFAPHLKQPFL